MQISIRKAEKKDACALSYILRQVGQLHAIGRPDIYQEGAFKHDEKSACEIILDDKTGVLVAEVENNVVGELIYRIENRKDDGFWKSRKWLYIDDLCVDSAYRGMGIAEKLNAYAEDIARSLDCDSVELNCWSFNERAKKFYEKIGYKQQKTEYEKILK